MVIKHVLCVQDVYAYAMICYELFSGRKPFGQIHPIEAARRACIDNARPQWTHDHINKCEIDFCYIGLAESPVGRAFLSFLSMSSVRSAHCRFGTRIPELLVALVEECWSPDFEDRPEVTLLTDSKIV